MTKTKQNKTKSSSVCPASIRTGSLALGTRRGSPLLSNLAKTAKKMQIGTMMPIGKFASGPTFGRSE